MVDQLIQVGWKQTWFKAGWIVPVRNANQVRWLSRWKLFRIPRSLRNPELYVRFQQLVSGTEFLDWWNETCGATGDKVFLLRFPPGIWNIPWELLIERLSLTRNLATVCLARTAGDITPFAPSLFDEPLRILLLKGASDELDLDSEVQLIQLAWESLELQVRQCVERPIVEQSTKEHLPMHLQKHRPHIIWFSGHGESQSDTRVKFADGDWVSASEFAQIIRNSGHKPLYAVFWACDTGRGAGGHSAVACTPSLFEEFRSIGILSVLAMQSPIRDCSALSMAQNLFRYLAVGLPLEKAVARSRAHLIENPPDEAYFLDWASPVIWSAGMPVEKLHWNTRVQKVAQYQVLGRYSLGWGQSRPQQLDAPIEDSAKSRANEWVKRSRIWVHGTIGEAEHRYYWLRTLQAIQSQTQWFVVAVELNSGDPAESLQHWAENVYCRMLPGDFPEEFACVLDQIARVPSANWHKLCGLEGIYLAIANPPKYGDDWFWEPLRLYSEQLRIAVLSDQEITTEVQSSWDLDRIDQVMRETLIKTVISKAPRLARALAMLNIPIRASYLSVEGGENEGASSLLQWPEWKSVMVDTSAGPIMTASARQYVLNSICTEQSRRETHLDCVAILGNPGLMRSLEIHWHRLEHLLGAGLAQEALLEASNLCYLYWTENRPFSVLRVLERLGNLKTYLPINIYLIIAQANLQLGRVEHSKYWLQRSQPKQTLDLAWKHCLQAELYKSAGTQHSKENALQEIDEAIRLCQETETQNSEKLLFLKKSLAYRQDRARIIHFLFYDLEQAAKEYDSLVKEWSDLPGSDIDLAVVKRNYAECLRTLATGPGNVQWQQAHDLLQDAEDLARAYPYAPVLSEILYEKAKVAEKEERWSVAGKYIIDECIEEATKSHHFMMLAIAEACAFWKKPKFTLKRWNEIESALKAFPNHGWAVRVLIDGRLRVAKILEDKRDYFGSLVKLEANLGDLRENPSFDKGGDRFRIAATLAGLQLLSRKMQKPVSYWQEFLSQCSWARDWLQERSIDTAAEVWGQVQ